MSPETQGPSPEWAKEQISQLQSRADGYRLLAVTLQDVLKSAARRLSPYAIVETRPKSVPSFAEKIHRKAGEHDDPVNQLTDLAGGRVITLSQDEVQEMCAFIEEHFEIDWENSIDISKRHKPSEFGYRSVHYIVSFKPGVFPSKDVPVDVPDALYPDLDDPAHPADPAKLPNPRAEIQVRTLLEHAWASVGHDQIYKAGYRVPDSIQRDFNGVAAILENADQDFSRVLVRLAAYTSAYGAYMTTDQIRAEIELQRFVLTYNAQSASLALRIAALAAAVEDWDAALEALRPFAEAEDPSAAVLREYGAAMCRRYANAPDGPEFRQGRGCIEKARELDPDDAGAVLALAWAFAGRDEEQVRDLHRLAYEKNPSDPYPLAKYIQAQIAYAKREDLCSAMAPAMRDALARCREHADAGVHVPESYFAAGFLHLLLDEPYPAMWTYAKAIEKATAAYQIADALAAVEDVRSIKIHLQGWEWAKRLLTAGLAARYPDEAGLKAVRELATPGAPALSGPVAIVAGGTAPEVEGVVSSYRAAIVGAFDDFAGTLVGGGTKEGASGIAGDIREKYGERVRTLAYQPRLVRPGATIDEERYDEVRPTEGTDFSALESVQTWVDLIASDVDPATVRLIGVNGGRISATEYRLALALGASVAILEGSGREAAKLLSDPDWKDSMRLVVLIPELATLRAFLDNAETGLDPALRDRVARQVHDSYRVKRRDTIVSDDPALADWDHLAGALKLSNLAQVDDIATKMRVLGYEMVPAEGTPTAVRFSDKEVEKLAEREHGRWNVERLRAGWKLGPRDVAAKTSPYLVAWDELSEDVKQYDRDAVLAIPDLLTSVGVELRRLG
jgi:ppGpp synthetase/RelA/SpoT-type nucleotidyltranferase